MRSTPLVVIIFSFALSFNTVAQTNKKATNEKTTIHKDDSTVFKFLRQYDKKYPYDIKLFSNTTLQSRLTKLLGKKYAFMKAQWAVESPIEIKNDLFIAYACQQHNCDATNFMIIVDIKHNLVYAGLREERAVKIYAEDGTQGPAELQEWAR